MKERKCPFKNENCIDYGDCEACDMHLLIVKYKRKITKLNKKIEDLQASSNYPSVVHAHWIKVSDVDGDHYICSNCRKELERVAIQNPTVDHPYGEYKSIEPTKCCPNCGAKMDEEQKKMEEEKYVKLSDIKDAFDRRYCGVTTILRQFEFYEVLESIPYITINNESSEEAE